MKSISESILNTGRALIPYVTAGLPNLETTGAIIKDFSDAGAAAIEIGIPFSDPMADGPVLQQASKLALDGGFKMESIFEHLKHWSSQAACPLIIMSYINPLMRHGLEPTLQRFKDAGVSGFIIPDEPADAAELFSLTKGLGLDLIRLVAPTTLPERRREVISQCGGFVYAVSVKGVTGARAALPPDLAARVKEMKAETSLPVCVGFGVSTASQVDEILGFADGVIVASFLMDVLMKADGDPVAVVRETYKRL